MAATTNREDVSGPCDEAEHANDPRCAGTAGVQAADQGDDDNSGPGSGDDDEDRSGPDSGSDDDDDDNGHHSNDD